MIRSTRVAQPSWLLPVLAALALGACEGSDSPAEPVPQAPADVTAPAFSVSQEQNATNQRTSTLGGVVTDSVGVTRLVVRVNGAAEQPVSITAGTSVTFSVPVTLPAVLNTVEFAAFDAAGNRATETLEVRYDTVAPTLTVSQLTQGGTFTSFLRISGVATDPETGIRRVTYSVNGGPETNITGGQSSSGYTFSTDAYGLPLGANTFVVTAYDRAGNRGQRTATMTRRE